MAFDPDAWLKNNPAPASQPAEQPKQSSFDPDAWLSANPAPEQPKIEPIQAVTPVSTGFNPDSWLERNKQAKPIAPTPTIDLRLQLPDKPSLRKQPPPAAPVTTSSPVGVATTGQPVAAPSSSMSDAEFSKQFTDLQGISDESSATVRGIGNLGKPISSGLARTAGAVGGAFRFVAENPQLATFLNPNNAIMNIPQVSKAVNEFGKNITDYWNKKSEDKTAAIPEKYKAPISAENAKDPLWWGYKISGLIGSSAPMLAGPAAPAAFGAQSFGETYDKLRAEGMSPTEASVRSGAIGAITTALTNFALGKVFKPAELTSMRRAISGILTTFIVMPALSATQVIAEKLGPDAAKAPETLKEALIAAGEALKDPSVWLLAGFAGATSAMGGRQELPKQGETAKGETNAETIQRIQSEFARNEAELARLKTERDAGATNIQSDTPKTIEAQATELPLEATKPVEPAPSATGHALAPSTGRLGSPTPEASKTAALDGLNETLNALRESNPSDPRIAKLEEVTARLEQTPADHRAIAEARQEAALMFRKESISAPESMPTEVQSEAPISPTPSQAEVKAPSAKPTTERLAEPSQEAAKVEPEPIKNDGATISESGKPLPPPQDPLSTSPIDPIALKNASTEKLRREIGLSDFAPVEEMKAQEMMRLAEVEVTKNPNAVEELVSALKANPDRAVASIAEEGLLTRATVDAVVARDAAMDVMTDPKVTSDRRAFAEDMYKKAVDRINEVTLIDKNVGTIQGRMFAFRKAMIKEDYSVIGAERKIKTAAAKQGIDLDSKIVVDATAKVTEAAKEIETREQLNRLHEENIELQKVIDDLVADVKVPEDYKITPRKPSVANKLIKVLDDASNAAMKRIQEKTRGKASAGVDPTLIADYAIVGASWLGKGTIRFGQFSARMIKTFGDSVKPHLPKIWGQAKSNYETAASSIDPTIKHPATDKVKVEPSVEEALAKVDPNAELTTAVVSAVARAHVAEGIKTREDLVAALMNDFKGMAGVTQESLTRTLVDYGAQKKARQDETSKTLRELKGQLTSVERLRDIVDKKTAPPKQGFLRDKPSNEKRRLDREVKQAMKDNKIEVPDTEGKLASVNETATTRLNNEIADVLREIKNLERDPKPSAPDYNNRVKRLQARKEILTMIRDRLVPPHPKTKEQNIEESIADAERLLKENLRMIEKAELAVKRNTPLVAEGESAKLDGLKAARKVVMEYIREARKASKDIATQEAEATAALEKRLVKQIQSLSDYKGKLAGGVIPVKAEPRVVKETQEILKNKLIVEKLKAEIDKKVQDITVSNQKWSESAFWWRKWGDLANFSKQVRLSIDISFLKNNKKAIYMNPRLALQAIVPTVKTMHWDQTKDVKYHEDIKKRPSYKQAVVDGLELTERAGNFGSEETTRSSFASRIPLVAGSSRGFVTYTNEMRLGMYEAFIKLASVDGRLPTKKDRTDIVEFVHIITSRGNVTTPQGIKAVEIGAKFLTSSRYTLSNFQFITRSAKHIGKTVVGKGSVVDKAIARGVARYLGVSLIIYGMLAKLGYEIGKDVYASNFGQINAFGRWLDTQGGLLQTIVLLARLGMGKKTIQSGETIDIYSQENRLGKDGALAVLGNFFWNKKSPAVSMLAEGFSGKGFLGESIVPKALRSDKMANNRLTWPIWALIMNTVPMSPESIVEVYTSMKSQGYASDTILAILALMGEGIRDEVQKQSKAKKMPVGGGSSSMKVGI